jgi:fructose/tagatose bisphosphate aldolase
VEYAQKVAEYVDSTGVDLMVADLGTEQQSTRVGDVVYLRDRARAITALLGSSRLVLHGTSSLSKADFGTLEEEGCIRMNMWTRIAREAGQAAAEKVAGRMDAARRGDFESCDSRAYFDDIVDRAAEIMEETLELLGYRMFSAGKSR